MHLKKTRLAALAGLVAVTLSACGGSSTAGSSSTSAAGGAAASGSEAASAPAAASGAELIVWADNSANTAKAIEPLCLKWAAENGVTCTIKKFNGGGEMADALLNGQSTGDVPDVIEGAHNGIGSAVKNGILTPIDLASNKDKFLPAAIQGVTYDGSTWGVPWAVENVALLTNKDLAPSCPATLDDAVANAKSLIAAGTVTSGLGIAMQIGEAGDSYHWNPLYTADGGYGFKQNPDGSFDASDMGVGKEGSIAAATRFQQLINEGIFGASVSYDIAREAFASGKSPYFITGPWQIPDQKAALGDKLMVCPVPTWADSTYESQPYLGVRTFMQPAKAKNAALASTFLNDEVMTTEFMDAMYAVDPRPPAWIESYEKAATDPFVKGFGEYGKQGIPMPSIPQNDAVLAELGLAQYKVATGADPAATMVAAGESITKQNAALN